ncbi:maestro heat-like repeat-containing protein family member 2A, partial [Chrysemys picta bellii]|uniref:maestro heat-like repeat-containing protein family member 2A n=1 Tax=Chrysemys picta bellii TaxID=8478 RepID=UPI0032B1E143
MNKFVSEQEVMDRGVYNEVVSLLANMDDQDKGKIALRIALIAETKLASVVTVLLEKLQQDERDRVDIYCVLEKILQQDTGGLERRLLNKIITLASNHMRETQEATNELKVAASNTLVTLARCYFYEVMYELQCRLKLLGLPEEFVFITLGNLSSAYGMVISIFCFKVIVFHLRTGDYSLYQKMLQLNRALFECVHEALECIPYVGMTLKRMFSMLGIVKDSRLRQAFCG